MLVRKRVIFLLCILTLITGNIISKVTFQDENVTNMIQNATECAGEVHEIAPPQPPTSNHTISGNGGEDPDENPCPISQVYVGSWITLLMILFVLVMLYLLRYFWNLLEIETGLVNMAIRSKQSIKKASINIPDFNCENFIALFLNVRTLLTRLGRLLRQRLILNNAF